MLLILIQSIIRCVLNNLLQLQLINFPKTTLILARRLSIPAQTRTPLILQKNLLLVLFVNAIDILTYWPLTNCVIRIRPSHLKPVPRLTLLSLILNGLGALHIGLHLLLRCDRRFLIKLVTLARVHLLQHLPVLFTGIILAALCRIYLLCHLIERHRLHLFPQILRSIDPLLRLLYF